MAARLTACQVSAAVFQAEGPGLQEKFLRRYMDEEVEEAMRCTSNVPDPMCVAAIRAVMRRVDSEESNLRAIRDAELADRVRQASLAQLMEHLSEDTRLILEYRREKSVESRSRETLLFRHREQRYLRGLAATEKKMAESYFIAEVRSPAEAPMHWSTMRGEMLKRQSGGQKRQSRP